MRWKRTGVPASPRAWTTTSPSLWTSCSCAKCCSAGCRRRTVRLASGCAFDEERLRELFGEDERELAVFLRFALESIREVVARLTGAVARRDGAGVRALAHELKGACANAGAPVLAGLGARVEQAGSARSWTLAERLLEELQDALADGECYVADLTRHG
ncbi:Hpt domain-containing protein [bacterium]|nr:MAG: Hpt domain-containing protein [bacterium]